MTLEEKILKLIELSHQENELENQILNLKESIMKEMDEQKLKTIETSKATATKSIKTTYKYNDEEAIMKYLKENGYEKYLETKIRKTDLNKELAKNGLICEGLKSTFTKNETAELKIKEKLLIE